MSSNQEHVEFEKILYQEGMKLVEIPGEEPRWWRLEMLRKYPASNTVSKPSKDDSLFSLIKKINDHEKLVKKKAQEAELLRKQKSTHKGRVALKNIQKAKNANKKRRERLAAIEK